MSQIRPDPDAMKIEHWRARGHHPEKQLDYSNLLAACIGNDGRRNADRYCETCKRGKGLSRNPANPSHRVEDLVRFLGDGTIISTDPVFDTELNEVLNLNLRFLVNSRKSVLSAFQEALGRRALSRADLRKWLEDWNGESGPGNLRPYCQVVVYWLRKRLARA